MERVLRFFREISKIPRGSGNTDKISEYCVSFAEKRGLNAYRDEFNNVIIRKPASKSYEGAEPVMLQAHLDMVCEAERGKEINFLTDPIELIEQDGILKANGTTLGADDGIGVAMILAVLDSDTILHPEIEAVFTTDEETGMDGALGIDLSKLKAKRLINLDSETEDTLTVSCAGGVLAECVLPLKKTAGEGKYYKISVDGLVGGHSGTDIDKGFANAILIIGRLLNALGDCSLCRIQGGDKHNCIPTSAYAVIKCDFVPFDIIEKQAAVIKKELESCDSGINIACTETEGAYNDYESKTADFLMAVPNGVISMSPDISGLVRTSLNLATIKTESNLLKTEFFIRSSLESEKEYLKNRLSVIVRLFGGKITFGGEYPAWEYNRNSELRWLMENTFFDMFGYMPKVEAIHAGLECGIFCGKIKGLDCVSVCPDIKEIHTPREHMELKSLHKAWKYFIEVLKRMEK